ncbi:MAG TPA: hypothetical protein VK721_06145 [Solirubrobacteraceae bacterium]|nr:hypothetical protein [Solirubrobacteraceae bacterium]
MNLPPVWKPPSNSDDGWAKRLHDRLVDTSPEAEAEVDALAGAAFLVAGRQAVEILVSRGATEREADRRAREILRMESLEQLAVWAGVRRPPEPLDANVAELVLLGLAHGLE